MRGKPRILSLFRNEPNKFNNTKARVLDFIYHITLKLLKMVFLAWKRHDFDILRNVMIDVIMLRY